MSLKGIKFTKEHKENISKAKIGKRFSEEHKEKLRKAKIGKKMPVSFGKRHSEIMKAKGDKHGSKQESFKEKMSGINSYWWKGGITPINTKLRNSKEYSFWRSSVFKRDNFTCIWCGKHGGKLNADHIKPFSIFPELRLAIDNGRTLCINCHKKTDTYGRPAKLKNIIQ